jgi:anaerobic magnesium-protoporphyrin IX monomethyl ester cyclase
MIKKEIDIFLVIPPQVGLLRGFATGLISLATFINLRLPDLNVEILDLSAENEESTNHIVADKFKVADKLTWVGITTTTASYQSSLRVAKAFKGLDKDCKVIFGGHHSSNDYQNILQSHADIVDFIIIGEGELAIVELLKNYPNVSIVPNLVYIDNKIIKQNSSARFLSVEELDEIQLSYKETNLYGSPGRFDAITYVSARGCPLKCSFCAVANEKMRSKSVSKVIEDMVKLVDLGYTNIAIEDNFFAHSAKRTKELCTALKKLKQKGYDFKWDCQTRVESVLNFDTVQLMDEAGCYAAYIGVEALDAFNLVYLGKTANPERYLEQLIDIAIPNFLNTSTDCYINIQFGLPKQTLEQISEMLDTLRKIGAKAVAKNKEITVFPQLHVIYPGTEHFRQGVRQGRFQNDVFEHFTIWEESQEQLYRWLGESFAHGTGGIPEGIMDTEMLAHNAFFMIPEKITAILNLFNTIKSIEGIKLFDYGNYLT